MPELPTGTVTFLFTDVEGSTRLLERFPAAYPAALARHETILRGAVETHGGGVFETVGDAVYAAFGRVSDALAATLEAQLALHAADWGEVGAIRARMGLHTGDVERRGDHYFGAALYRCARLMATAHGGQTVLSGVTAGMSLGALPQGTSLRSLGWHRLKDLGEAEHVFQLEHAGLPSHFPPLRSLDNRPNNLPSQTTPIVGRQQTIEAIMAQLGRADVRLLTLIGPGGIGKTRLALEVARQLENQFSDGVWLVELAALSDASLVPQTVALSLGIRDEPGRPIRDALTDYLRSRQLLLILDNCEHVIDACAQVVDTLLRSCPRVQLLATSRELLGVDGEVTWRVTSLSVVDPQGRADGHGDLLDKVVASESGRLFFERARLVAPSFAITTQNAPAVAQVCHRLDGIAGRLVGYRPGAQ